MAIQPMSMQPLFNGFQELNGFRDEGPFIIDFTTAQCSCLLSLDQLIRPGEHLRRNRQADLLRRLEIDH